MRARLLLQDAAKAGFIGGRGGDNADGRSGDRLVRAAGRIDGGFGNSQLADVDGEIGLAAFHFALGDKPARANLLGGIGGGDFAKSNLVLEKKLPRQCAEYGEHGDEDQKSFGEFHGLPYNIYYGY